MRMEQSAPKRRHIKGTYLPIKMEQTECSETSAYKRYLPAYGDGKGVPKRRHIKGTYLPIKMEQSAPKRRYIKCTYLPMKTEQSVPKLRHIKGTYLPMKTEQSAPKRRHIKGTYLPMKMEQCSVTSAYTIQTPGNYSEESIRHSEYGEKFEIKNTLN